MMDSREFAWLNLGVLCNVWRTRGTDGAMNQIQELFETLPGCVWRTFADGGLDRVNPGMLAYLGKIGDDLKRDWWSCVHPEDRPDIGTATASLLDKSETTYPPLRIRRHDGVYRWFQCIDREFHDERGMLNGRCGMGWDIHDTLVAARDLREREGAIRSIVDCIPGFVWQLGSSGELQYLNNKVFEYTGKSLEGLREPGWRDCVHPDDVESFVGLWARALQDRKSITVEFRLRRADGVYRWFRTIGAPILNAQGGVNSWCGVDIDIDEEKRVDRGLRSAQSQLARTAQLAIAAELTASTANAINQPLAAVVANAFACQRWLSRTPPNVARAAPILDLIVQDSKAVAAIVKRIMAIIKGAPPTNSPVDVNSVIEDVIRLQAEDLQEQGIAVVTKLEPNLPMIQANAPLLRQVLVNLLRNAIDALGEQRLGPKILSIVSRREPGELAIEVGDNGGGYLDGSPLFEAFYTTKNGRLGLGLAIVRSIVESYAGRVWAHHNDPIGSIVGFSLPT
jgi:PAS domain S-box-containing protein